MKKIYSILLLLVVLILAITLEQINLTKTLSVLNSKVDNLLEVSSNYTSDLNELTPLIDDIEGYWKNQEKTIHLTYNYKDVEKIGEQISRVKSNITVNNKENMYIELKILSLQIQGFEHLVSITFQNIL